MLVLNYTQFTTLIEDQNGKAIFLFEGHGDMVVSEKHVNPFKKFVCGSTEALLQELETFAGIYPAKFTAYIHTTDKAITTHGTKCHTDLYARQKDAVVVQGSSQQLDEEAIIKRVTKQITQQAEANLVKQKLELAEAKLDKLENASERIAMVAMAVMDQLTGGAPAGMQGTDEPDESAQDSSEQMDIKKAVHFLRTQFGDKTLIDLAEKVKKDPKLVAKLKMFI